MRRPGSSPVIAPIIAPVIAPLIAALLLTGCSNAPKGGSTQVPFAGTARVHEEPTLRVALVTNAAAAELSADGSFRLLGPGLDDSDVRFPAGTKLTVRRNGERLDVEAVDGPFRLTTPAPLRLVTEEDQPVRVETSRYRGGLEIVAGAATGITILNRVPMEEYLRGVVPNEIGHGDPALLEAVKAQSVAARTYAVISRGQYEEQGYDLVATVADQVYTGVEGEAPNSDRGIRETRGIVALHHGEPIVTNYASTCGGHTADRDEVWDKPPLPYLKGVSDKGGDGFWCARSKYFRWEETWTGEEFWKIARSNLVREFGPEIPGSSKLEEVRITETGQSGRVRRLEFRTTAGTFTARGDRIRWIIQRPAGAGALRSTLFTLEVDHAKGRVSRVRATGAGWGHGVGMCQWGAMQRSRGGQDYKEILTRYYQGIKLAALYS